MLILETERLRLRKLEAEDFAALCRVLQDEAAMYAYAHAFSDAEVQDWLDRQRARYREDGFGLWAVELRQSGRVIGQCGLTMQDFGGRRVPEIGYLFERAHWHRGYATEAAVACKLLAFCTLELDAVYSIIRDNNLPSQAVALRNGMVPVARSSSTTGAWTCRTSSMPSAARTRLQTACAFFIIEIKGEIAAV